MPRSQSSTSRTQPLLFRQAPLAPAALWLAIGIALARFASHTTLHLVVALTLLLVLAILGISRAPRVSWLPVAALWLVVGLAAAEWRAPPTASVTLPAYADGLSRSIRATVTRIRPLPPRAPAAETDPLHPWEASETLLPAAAQALSVDLALSSVEYLTPDRSTMVPITGGVRATLYADAKPNVDEAPSALPTFACGDVVEGDLRLRPLQTFRDPGAFAYADVLQAQGIDLHASAPAVALHKVGTSPPSLPCRLAAAQAWSSARLQRFTTSPENLRLPPLLRLDRADTSMLDAMLFGDRTGLDHALRTGFERTGSFHLFVVSGLHVALLAGGVFWLLRRLLRLPLWLVTLSTITISAAYAALTGFGQPVQRSLAMVTVFLLARLLSRERNSLNALGAAALAMLLWAPSSLFDASLQMTLLAVIAIAGIARPLAEWTILPYAQATRPAEQPYRPHLPPGPAQFRLTLELFGASLASAARLPALRRAPALLMRPIFWILELALIGAVAELVMILPMSLYFHRATIFALPANMVVLPVVGLLAPAAVATFAASLLSPSLALFPGAFTALLLHGIRAAIAHISRVGAADLRVPGPALPVAVAAAAAFVVLCWLVRRSRLAALLTACALPLIAAAVLWPEPPSRTPGRLEISALDVGQGDSLLAVSPEGRTMLIDAGGPVGQHGVTEVVSTFDVGEQVVSPFLWSRRLRRLDVVVLTHAHTDHMGGLPAILENFRPRELWLGPQPQSPLLAALLAQAAALGVQIRHFHAGDHVAWGSVAVDVLGPAPDYINPGTPKNDDSLVLHLQFGRASVLLAGDAEAPSERTMLAAGLIHPVTLLKVGHHGSHTSSTPEFLAAAAPVDAVVSSGRGNPFGHPRADVIERFAAAHTRLFRIDEFGLTTFLLAPDGSIQELVHGTPVPPYP